MKDEIALQFLQIVILLFAAAAAWIMLAWRRRGFRESRIWTVYCVEMGIVTTILVPAYLGGIWLGAMAVGLCAVTCWELYGALHAAGDRPRRHVGMAVSCVFVGSALFRPELSVIALPVLLAVALLARFAASRLDSPTLASGSSTLVGILFPGLCIAHFVAIGTLEGGFGYLVFLYALIEINDVAAFLVGGAIGRRKLWPGLSSNKTVEGSLAGALACVALAFPLSFTVPGLSVAQLLGAGLLLAVAGQAGDLIASGFKRRAEIKDFSELVPTQGGVLDVYDSVVAVSPLFYYYLRLGGP